MRRRHIVFWTLLRPLVIVFLFFKFGYRFHVARDLPDHYIVLSNHNTDFDPLFVAASFPRQMYFVASEHIARWPRAYRFLKFAFAPIIRHKGSTAASTVMEMLRTLRAGGNVCMFAEGARSWDGVTAPILPSTGKVVKNARCGLVTYRLEGGYFVSPNWSEGGTRRGRIRGAAVRVYTAEQLASMSVSEINAAINADLHEDAYARQLTSPARYRGRQPACRLENLLFRCPACTGMNTLTSGGDTVTCSQCGLQFRYTDLGMLEGLEQQTVKELFAWERALVEQDAAAGAAYTAAEGSLTSVDSRSNATPVSRGPVRLDADSLSCGDASIPLSQITDMAMHGRNALVFSSRDAYYELIPDRAAGALKFHMLFQAYKYGSIKQYS